MSTIYTFRLQHCISEHKLGSSFPTENPCSWCSAEICRVLGCLLPFFLPSPQGSRCLSHFFSSLLPAGQHLVLYPTVSPCGCRAQPCPVVVVWSCQELAVPSKGHPGPLLTGATLQSLLPKP